MDADAGGFEKVIRDALADDLVLTGEGAVVGGADPSFDAVDRLAIFVDDVDADPCF